MKTLDRPRRCERFVKLLGDPRPAVQQLRDRVPRRARPAKEAARSLLCARSLASDPSLALRRNAVWTLTRIDRSRSREVRSASCGDPDETVRQAAIHSVGLWRDRAAVPRLIKLLEGSSMHNRRAAAEALGRIGEKTAVPALLAAAGAAG